VRQAAISFITALNKVGITFTHRAAEAGRGSAAQEVRLGSAIPHRHVLHGVGPDHRPSS
jgi:hypothetical protein